METEITIDVIRLENARALAASERTHAEFARKIGADPSRISQIIGKNPTKNIGDDTARHIESVYNKKRGWMDTRKSGATISMPAIKLVASGTPTNIEIPQYDTGGSMGNGLVLQDQPGAIRSWVVTPEWIRKNVPDHTGTGNLAIVTGFGPSMRPMFNPGDPLLVDRGIKEVNAEAVYFFRIGDQGFIKHIQRIPGVGLIAISENSRIYKEFTITPDMDFEVLAKVIKVWCGTDF